MYARRVVSGSILLSAWIFAVAPAKEQVDGFFQVLYDTTAPVSAAYQTDMGYAVFVSFDGINLLLDTGADPSILRANMDAAGIDPADLDVVAISHGHFDHAGGLAYIREAAAEVPVYSAPNERLDGGVLRRIDDHLQIATNIYLIRTHTDAPTSGIADELSVLIKTRRGPYLITACSHTGVPTILDRAESIAGRSIYYYAGGARLMFRPAQDTLETARLLKRRSVAHVSPGHCSADHQVAATFQREFDTGYVSSRLGEKVTLQLPP
jgi:7,8-dihydropterin-6-yl-methyl-4-(beta-D-ribofuranosyl)aminobenzene 5'-phosphate synthase